MLRFVVAILPLLLPPVPLPAQAVEGRVTTGSGEPLGGALVHLLDAAGEALRGALAGGDGRFNPPLTLVPVEAAEVTELDLVAPIRESP